MSTDKIDQLCINTIRTLAMDAVQQANSGHPGTPMGLAPTAYVLWQRFLRFDPADPIWPNRDRFVLSAGHASMLLYSLLHLAGVKAVIARVPNAHAFIVGGMGIRPFLALLLPLLFIASLISWQTPTPSNPELPGEIFK
jgi:hypothetical protein